MPKISRRLLVFVLVFVLALQVIIAVPLLAETRSTELQETKVTLEQAIKIVKENFEIPATLTEFTSGFSNYDNRQSWSLNWNSTGEKRESFSAQVDALSGEIISIYAYKPYDDEQAYRLPALTQAEAKASAEKTVKKLTGEKFDKLKYVENDSIIPLDLYGSSSYSFNWERTENGIPVQGNGVRIQIDASKGEVLSYNFTWHTLDLPKADKIISTEQATQAFNWNKMLQLQYFLAPAFKPLTTGSKEQVQLVYQLNKNGLIDALSGKPLQLGPNQYLVGDEYVGRGFGYDTAENAKAKSTALTPQELQEIEKNTKLLSKEEAVKVVQKWVEIPSGLSLRTMNLNTDSSLSDTKVWYFEWAAAGRERMQNITARVDAVTGELIGFYIYTPRPALTGSTGQQATLSKKDAQALAEEFLIKIQPDKFKQSKLKADPANEPVPVAAAVSKAVSDPVADKAADTPAVLTPEETSASFNYERIVNGIVFPSNGINVTVDLFSKKITSYNLSWYSLDFPALSQALVQSKAEEAFLKARPMILKYVLVNNDGIVNEANLAYRPANDGNRVSDIIDAKTGQFLDWQGKPLTAQPRSYHFTDIAGLEAEKEITALGQAGIFGEYGDLFKPAENISAESLFRALFYIRNGAGDYSLTAEEILKKAKEQGWLKEEVTPAQTISRELFSKIIVRYLGLEKIAELKDIYKPAFQDTDKSQGYIALTTGLGIINVNGRNFEPAGNVTRAEAASSIIKALGNRL